MEATKKAYKEILKVLHKYKDKIVFDVEQLEDQAKTHLFGVELVEKYGFNLDPKSIRSRDYQRLKEYIYLCYFDGHRRKISWPDDGRQPINEMLLLLSYPTGAYIFGDDYPTDFFQRFFLELKSYKPKYIDSHNQSLYFSLDNAATVFNDYDEIFRRYYEENKENKRQRKIKKMKEELSKLESEK